MLSVFKVGRGVVSAAIVASAIWIAQAATTTSYEYPAAASTVVAKVATTRDGYWNRKAPLLRRFLVWLQDILNVPKP